MLFGNRLKNLRIEHNLTQFELAEKVKLSKANISKYEANLVEPSLSTLSLISSLFDVSIDYLLGKTDSPKAQYNSSDKLNLSSTEEHVVTTFRKLTPEDQNYIVKTIDIVSAQYPSEENTYDIAAFKSHKHINIEDE